MSFVSSGATPDTGAGAEPPEAALLPALMDNLTFGVILADASSKIVYVNNTLCRFFALDSAGELRGLSLQEATPKLLASVVVPDAGSADYAEAEFDLRVPSTKIWRLRTGRAFELCCSPCPLPDDQNGCIWQFREVVAPLLTVPVSHPDEPTVVENAPVILFALNADGVITTVEGNLPGQWQQASLTYQNRPVAEALAGIGLHGQIAAFQRALAGEDVMTTIETPEMTLDVNLIPVRDERGAVERVLGVIHDSAPRLQTERLLRRHNDYLETLHQTTLDLLNRLDTDDLLQSIVQRAAALLGTSHGYIYLVEPDGETVVSRYGSGLFSQTVGFRMQRGEGVGGKVLESGVPLVVDNYDTWPGRSPSWERGLVTAVGGVPLRAGGHIVGVIGVALTEPGKAFLPEEIRLLSQFAELASVALENARLYRSAQDEIAERKRTEAALRQSEKRYRSVVTAMGEGIIVLDDSGVVSDVNEAAARLFAVNGETLVGRHIRTFEKHVIQPDGTPFDVEKAPAMVTLTTGQPQSGVIMGIRHADERLSWLSVNSQPITGDDGRPAAVVVSFSNITEHKQIQAELQRRVDMLAALQKVDIDLNKSLDVDYVLATALDQTMQATGAPAGFIMLIEGGEARSIHASPGFQTEAAQMVADWRADNTWAQLRAARGPVLISVGDMPQVVLPLVSQDRLIGLSVCQCSHDRASHDNLAFLELVSARIATALDNARLFQISQTQLAELQVVYSQVKQLEELKTQMIQVAAHDIRSPLGVVGGYVTILRDELVESSAHYAPFFEAIFRALERIEQMTGDILSLERIHASDEKTYVQISFSEIVERVIADHRDLAQINAIDYRAIPVPKDVYIRGDEIQLYEAMANLLNNAIKYTPEGGQVTIEMRANGDQATFKVMDTGFGVPDDAKPMLFQPFYRVKTDDTRMIDGTGLGLYLVKGIIERHNGSMLFDSEADKGSTFGFTLPLAPTPPQAERASSTGK